MGFSGGGGKSSTVNVDTLETLTITPTSNSQTYALSAGELSTYDVINIEDSEFATTIVTFDNITSSEMYYLKNSDTDAAVTFSNGSNTVSVPAGYIAQVIAGPSGVFQLISAPALYEAVKVSSNIHVVIAASDTPTAFKSNADYVCTGTADQTIINSAIAAANGGTVELLAGNYITNGQITIANTNTQLIANGSAIIKPTGSAFHAILIKKDNVLIRDIKIDGTSLSTSGYLIYSMGTDVTITNCIFTNVVADGAFNVVNGAYNNNVKSCNFSGSPITTMLNIAGHSTNISDNRINNTNTSKTSNIILLSASRIQITNNKLIGVGGDCIYSSTPLYGLVIKGNEIQLTSTSSTQNANLCKYCINIFQPANCIISENFLIPKGSKGYLGASGIIIAGTAVASVNVIISNNTIQGNPEIYVVGNESTPAGMGIFIQGNTNQMNITGNTIHGEGGINCAGTFGGSNITGNSVAYAFGMGSTGIYISYGYATTLTGNMVYCQSSTLTSYGIQIAGGSLNTVVGNFAAAHTQSYSIGGTGNVSANNNNTGV